MRNHCFTFKSNSLFYIIHFPFIKWILIYLFIYFGRGGFKNLKKTLTFFSREQKNRRRRRRRRMNEHSVCMNEDISSSTNYFFFNIFFVRDFQNVYKNACACALSLTHTHTHKLHTQIYTPLLHFTSLHFLLFTILFL